MRETASAALRPASPAEVEAWRKAFGKPPSVPRQRGQTPKAAWQAHNAYMDKLRDAFTQSFGRTPTGQQSHDIPLLTFAEGRTRQVLTQTAKRVERYWELASWDMTAIHLPTCATKREYETCHDAVQQADQSWDSAHETLDVAHGQVEELLRAARGWAGQSSSADDALHAVILMQLKIEEDYPFDEEEWSEFAHDLRKSNQRVELELFRIRRSIRRIRRNPRNEAVWSSFAEACRSLQTKLLTVQGVADHPVIAAYNTALDVVVSTRHRLEAAYTALWQQGERIVVLLHAKGEYRDPDDLTIRLRGRDAQVRGVPIVRVTFERSESRERLLQTAGQAYHDQVQTDALS